MPWQDAFTATMTAVGASGVATVIAAVVTARTSGKVEQPQPNGERRRLQSEVDWLRRELERYHDSDP